MIATDALQTSDISGFTLKNHSLEGIHFQAGFSSNSAFIWEVNSVRAKLAWRGMIQRKAAEVIREQVGA